RRHTRFSRDWSSDVCSSDLPRQRRGVFFLVVTSILAVAVFVGVLSYVRTVSSQVGPMVTVLRLTESVDALEPVEESMLESVRVRSEERRVGKEWRSRGRKVQ